MSQKTQETYLELISKDKEEIKKEGFKIKAQEASISVQRDIMNLNSDLASLKGRLERSKRQIPYSATEEYNITQKITAVEAKLAFIRDIKEIRFNDVSI